jgi:hypothetical protein
MLASAPQGQRAFGLRDWAVAYVVTWIWPAPVGLILLAVPLLVAWALRWMDVTLGHDSGLMLVFGLGWVLFFAPLVTWVGLILSLPLVWAALRFGRAGWITFVLGGALTGWMAAGLIGGMAPVAPILFAVLSALVLRLLMGMMQPTAFLVKKNG